MTFVQFYTTWLVPIFATIAFFLSVYKAWADWRRDARRVELRVDGASFMLINHSSADVFWAYGGYIDKNWKAAQGSFEPKPNTPMDGRIPRNGWLEVTQTLNTTLSAAWEAMGDPKISARGWWASLVTGERVTTIPWWNFWARYQFWVANARP